MLAPMLMARPGHGLANHLPLVVPIMVIGVAGFSPLQDLPSHFMAGENKVGLAQEDSEVCSSDSCKTAADFLKGFLDESKDPCTDFAAFTCSPAKKMMYKPACAKCGETDWLCKHNCGSSTWEMLDNTNSKMSDYVKASGAAATGDAKAYLGSGLVNLTTSIGKAYNECTKHSADCAHDPTAIGCVEPILRYMRTIPNDHPVEEVIAGASRINNLGFGDKFEVINPIFYAYVEFDYEKPNEGMKIHVSPRICGDNFEKIKSTYLHKAKDIAKAIWDAEGAIPPEDFAFGGTDTPMDAVIAFDKTFLQSEWGSGECEDDFGDYDNPVRLAELQVMADEAAGGSLGIDLQKIMRALGISGNPKVYLPELDNFQKWAENVQTMFAPPLEVNPDPDAEVNPADYINSIHTREAFAALRLINIVEEMLTEVPSDQCVQKMLDMFPWFFSRKFAKDAITSQARDDAEEIAWDVLEAFERTLDETSWMDAETRRAAKVKARHVHMNVGWPRWIFQDDTLLSRYDGMVSDAVHHGHHPHPMPWWEVVLGFRHREFRRALQTVGRPRDWDTDWAIAPMTLDPDHQMYQPLANSLYAPAALLQKPDFDDDAAIKAFNFAAIGFEYGQQLIHGFDAIGRERGPFGDYHTWWSDKVNTDYQSQYKCYADQITGNTVYGDKEDGSPDTDTEVTNKGERCIFENIADSGALGLAHRAYAMRTQAEGKEPRLVGLEKYTPDQLFFMRYGASMCDYKTAAWINKGQTSRVAPLRVRAVAAVQNSRSFAEAFKCPADAKMAPPSKCELFGKEGAEEAGTPAPTASPTPSPAVAPVGRSGLGGGWVFLLCVVFLLAGGGGGFYYSRSLGDAPAPWETWKRRGTSGAVELGNVPGRSQS